MGNVASVQPEEKNPMKNINTITVIKTDGNEVAGISLMYKKEDEQKLLNKLQETLYAQTESFERPKPEISNVEEELKSIQEQDDLNEDDEVNDEPKKMYIHNIVPVPKAFNEKEHNQIISKIEDILAAKSETFNPQSTD